MGALDDLRAAMRSMIEPKPYPEPLMLFVPPIAFNLGEAEVRRIYRVGTDIEIVESVPIAYAGDSHRPPRRYPSAIGRNPKGETTHGLRDEHLSDDGQG